MLSAQLNHPEICCQCLSLKFPDNVLVGFVTQRQSSSISSERASSDKVRVMVGINLDA